MFFFLLPQGTPKEACAAHLILQELMLLGPAREMHCAAALLRGMDWREASCTAQMLAPLANEGKLLLALSGVCFCTDAGSSC